MLTAELTFSQQVAVELLKAVFTAIFVAGGAGLIVWRFQSKAEEERTRREHERLQEAQDRERVREEQAQERDRERNELARARESEVQREHDERVAKTDLVTRSSDLAGSFYFLTQRFWRQKNREEAWGAPDARALDEAYVAWATKAEALERELAVRYGSDSTPEILWHQIRDLLTVRYFDLRDRNSMGLRRANAKTSERMHSGLAVAQLSDMSLLIATFRDASKRFSQALFDEQILL